MSGSRTRIKICGITRVQDGVAAAQCGADAIGLVFWHGTPRRVDAEAARVIVSALPPFVVAVGLFVNPREDEVRSILDQVPLAALQFHGNESPEFCRLFRLPYVKALAVGGEGSAPDLLESGASYADAAGWLFDAPPREGLPGGTGHTFDWALLPASRPRPLVLSGGLDVANVALAVRTVKPWAVDVSSGVEAIDAEGKPLKGIKDAAKIAAFVREVRNADG